eukprot:TRINITY_DN49472_c0_g1_i1.p1 TRINITY_DN49472_c0_g1~~TRINITY_DN49472_c0_g1_i1.p1  ORF type:complete len:817 (-),score=83.55 TRINITY_DN49472_c0_g1_i1:232-2682(-)
MYPVFGSSGCLLGCAVLASANSPQLPSVQCAGNLAPSGAVVSVLGSSYQRMIERTCHWNCYTADHDFFPPPPPKYWRAGEYSVAQCAAWCDSLPGCTGFEYPSGCSQENETCRSYPDKAIPGSYCALFFNGICSSAFSPGFHVSPGYDTYLRLHPAEPQKPYYAYSEELTPTLQPPFSVNNGSVARASAKSSRTDDAFSHGPLPSKVAELLNLGHGFGHLEDVLQMQLAMKYPIFHNATALLPQFPLYEARVEGQVRKAAWNAVSNLTVLFGGPVSNDFAGWTVAAALLLMLQLYDQTHEIVLGNHPLQPTAETWDWLRTFQTYPNSYWLYRPESPENHYLHGILHRIEGHYLGEAGLFGFDNSKFWFGGGVEKPAWGLGVHPVYERLAKFGREFEPLRRCCIFDHFHDVIVPPGRKVRVAPGWDPFAFVDFHRSVVESTQVREADVAALRWAQRFEFESLFNYSMHLAVQERADPWLSGQNFDVDVILHGKTYHLWAQRWGGGSKKVLLLHGGPGCSHFPYDPLTQLLSPYEYELIFFDQLGGGQSDCSKNSSSCYAKMPASLDDYVEQIEQVRVAMQLRPEDTIIFGHSFGVLLTIEYALRYPQMARGLVLGGFPASLAAQMRRMKDIASWGEADFFSSFICRSKPCPPSVVYGAGSCNLALDAKFLWTDHGMACTGSLCGWDRYKDLHRISTPTLLLVGDYDIAAPADVFRMAKLMPHSRAVQVPDAGHAEFVDNPAVFLSAFSDFAASLFGEGHSGGAAELLAESGSSHSLIGFTYFSTATMAMILLIMTGFLLQLPRRDTPAGARVPMLSV